MLRRLILVGLAGTAMAVFGLVSATSANSPSLGFAGYVITSPPPLPSATVTFTVPTLVCTSAPSAQLYFGLAIPVAIPVASASVVAQCLGGAAKYHGIIQFGNNTHVTTFAPVPGDVIIATVSMYAAQTEVTLRDVTAARSRSYSFVGGSASQVEVGIFAGNVTPVVVPNFGTVTFQNAKMDGTTLKAAGALAYNMRNRVATLQIKTSALNTFGKRWSEIFEHH